MWFELNWVGGMRKVQTLSISYATYDELSNVEVTTENMFSTPRRVST